MMSTTHLRNASVAWLPRLDRMSRLIVAVFVTMVGCDSSNGGEPALTPTPLEEMDCGVDEAVVSIETADGIELVADLLPAPEASLGAVVLFHMRPPTYDRRGYPRRVREALNELNLTVLNVDRRGGGDSEGIAEEAFEGPGALLDMEAAVRLLLDPRLACPIDSTRLVLVGASNGTTAVMDYSIAHDAALPHPAGLVWMSPIGATENQHTISDHRDILESMPMLWLYPTTEDYARDYIDDAPSSWTFIERGEAHGTDMFDRADLEGSTLGDLLPFVEVLAED